MSNRICIPDYEYKERIAKAAKLIREKGLDVMVVASTESDYANARYFSGFCPLFERAGVAISATGEAALMVGPESAIFAKDVSKLDNIFVLREFRESADPSYPELKADTFNDVFENVDKKIIEHTKYYNKKEMKEETQEESHQIILENTIDQTITENPSSDDTTNTDEEEL